MIKFKRLAVMTAALAVSAVVFAGCSGSDGASSSDTATEAASSAEADGDTDESTAAGEETVSADEEAIAAIDPVKPDDMGTVELGEYKGLRFTAPMADTVVDSDVDEYMEAYIMPYLSTDVTGEIEDGDTAVIDYVGKMDGEEFDGGSASGYSLVIGSGTFIDGFETGLIGHKAGDEFSLNLKFPDNYGNTDYAGKAVVFDVTVQSVTRPKSVGDFDDADAESMSGGEYTTASEYRDKVKEMLQLTMDVTAKNYLYSDAVTAAVQMSSADPTEDAVDWLIDMYFQNYDYTLEQNYQMGLADLISMYGMTYDDYRDSVREEARETTKDTLVVETIADAEGLKYDDDSVQAYADEFGYDVDTLKDTMTDDWLEQSVMQYLVGKLIADNGDITYITMDEYEQQLMEEAEAEAADTEALSETLEEAEEAAIIDAGAESSGTN